MRRTTAVIMLLTFMVLAVGCAEYHQQQGAGTGAVIGGVTGVILDSRNPWRGGVIGGILGAIAGATIADISYRASMEAASQDRPVEYRTEDGRGVYRADPMGYDERSKCKRVHERVWEDGRLVRDHVREVCTDRYERRDHRW